MGVLGAGYSLCGLIQPCSRLQGDKKVVDLGCPSLPIRCYHCLPLAHPGMQPVLISFLPMNSKWKVDHQPPDSAPQVVSSVVEIQEFQFDMPATNQPRDIFIWVIPLNQTRTSSTSITEEAVLCVYDVIRKSIYTMSL